MSSAEARAAELVVRYNALIESLRAAHRMLRRGLVSRGIQMLEEELDGVLSDDGESGESEASEADETVPVQDISLEDVQAALLAQIPQPPAAPSIDISPGKTGASSCRKRPNADNAVFSVPASRARNKARKRSALWESMRVVGVL